MMTKQKAQKTIIEIFMMDASGLVDFERKLYNAKEDIPEKVFKIFLKAIKQRRDEIDKNSCDGLVVNGEVDYNEFQDE